MFRLLVAGGREFYNYHYIEEVLTDWYVNDFSESLETWEDSEEGITLVHGDSSGVDKLAAMWAIYNKFIVEPHVANWKKFGKAAGPIRNKEMANSGLNYAIIFPGGVGTNDMINQLVVADVNYRLAYP